MDGWIEWNGGECPIPDAELANYKLRLRGNKEVFGGNFDAYIWTDWEHKGDEFDIIAYRLIEQEQSDLDWLEAEIERRKSEIGPSKILAFGSGLEAAYKNVLDLIKQRKGEK